MANSIRLTPDGIEGTSPTELRANYVDVERQLYSALVDLVSAVEKLKLAKELPRELELPLKRLEKAIDALK